MADPYDLSAAARKQDEPARGATQPEPRILVDSDWKKEAQAQKEKFAAQERDREEAGGAADAEALQADFPALVRSVAMQALLYLGGLPDPETGRAIVALDYGRHYIDLLEVLEKKTKGNLTADEETELRELLADLRARFVHVSRSVAAAMAERAAGGPAGPGGVATSGPRPGATPKA